MDKGTKIAAWLTTTLHELWPGHWNLPPPEPLDELNVEELDAFLREMYPPTVFDDPPSGSIILTRPVLQIDYDAD